MSYETRYAAHMRQKADAAASTPEAAQARVRLQDALSRGQADREARFPELTAENAALAMEYQDERIRYWRATLCA